MSLEEQIAALTEAVKANTAALLKGGGAGAATAKPAATKPGKITVAQLQAAVEDVKEKVSTVEAKAIITGVGGSKNLANLVTKPEKFAAVMAACAAKLKPADEDDTLDTADEDDL